MDLPALKGKQKVFKKGKPGLTQTLTKKENKQMLSTHDSPMNSFLHMFSGERQKTSISTPREKFSQASSETKNEPLLRLKRCRILSSENTSNVTQKKLCPMPA